MSDPIALVRWRDAENDPPDTDRYVTTDLGVAHYIHGDWWRHNEERTFYECLADPPPMVWCDPVPPGDGPLTVEDLLDALAALIEKHRGWVGPSAARLRHAIENLEAQDE